MYALTLMMPRQTEPSVNNVLGNVLQQMLPTCDVKSEHTRVVVDEPRLQIDILITSQGRSPVAMEAEYLPAINAESEAKSRLGKMVVGQQRPIESVIAVRYPEYLGEAADLSSALTDIKLDYCVFTQNGMRIERFPESGWLSGTVSDLADMIRLISVPQRAAEEAAAKLEQGIDLAVAVLNEFEGSRPQVLQNIADKLGMANVLQTRRMACAIVANAMVFHERLVGTDHIEPLDQLLSDSISDPKPRLLDAWSRILEINYWSIFAIAKSIVEQLPAGDAAVTLRTLRHAAGEVIGTGIDNAHDLTGRIFQRLIADRKYLATFYTRPASATLLARLAVSKMDDVDWSDSDAIDELRIGDFACGTGALLSAVYDQIAARHERSGGDLSALHPIMMENVLYGCDVMPSATHITGATLSGMAPNVQYQNTQLYTLAYGPHQYTGVISIGSLELLRSSSILILEDTIPPATRVTMLRDEPTNFIRVNVPDNRFNLVIMNPPFTRATNHEGAHADVTNPAFAAFGATNADQATMGRRMNELGKGTCYHGNAGIASAFAALADCKLKPGGVLALVLPLSASVGLSWKNFRRMLAREYTDITILSIAGNGKNMSFSADTGMAECLVIARKLKSGETTSGRITFVSLNKKTSNIAHANVVVRAILNCNVVRRIEDGPFGGTPLIAGDSRVGELITAPVDDEGGGWTNVRLHDASLAQTAFAMSKSILHLPGISSKEELKTAPLGVKGTLGVLSRDINGPRPRGPFDKMGFNRTGTYQALWNHNAKNETKMVCSPDSELIVRIGMEEKAHAVWETRSRSHHNVEFTFGSQALSVAFTERKTVGGRVWPNVGFLDDRFDYVMSVWGNSTLGLLNWWWHANRQQSSKASISIRSAESLPVLDFRTLSDEQLAIAKLIFDEFRDKELKPAYLADVDLNRALLDRRVICDLLGFGDDVYEAVRFLAQKWCSEPSVHGGKKRSRSAKFVL